jgi:hypothetical protein
MIPKTIILFLFLTFIFSCTNDAKDNQDDVNQIDEIDSTLVQDIDTIDIEMDTIEDNVVYDDPEVQEAHKEIVKKYGIQWDFCTCIVKNDSVDKALQADNLSDEDFDLLFERSEFIDSKCKGLLIQPNATPDERAKHEKKVKKCLQAAK